LAAIPRFDEAVRIATVELSRVAVFAAILEQFTAQTQAIAAVRLTGSAVAVVTQLDRLAVRAATIAGIGVAVVARFAGILGSVPANKGRDPRWVLR
jgi:hypothetical protein